MRTGQLPQSCFGVVLLCLLAGCQLPFEVDAPEVDDAFFPHDPIEEFRKGAVHGAEVLKHGATDCRQCHVEGSTVSPPCEECHLAFPHVEGWGAGAQHGADLLVDDLVIESCSICHGVEGLRAPQCTACHTVYPHADQWAEPGNHGLEAVKRGSAAAACGACHGPALQGGDVDVACDDCHFPFPHPDGWREPTQHPVSYLEDPTACQGCHGTEGDGGSSGVACARCHQPFPHPEDWATTHLPSAEKLGEAVCAGCHEPGFGPVTMVATCARRCHGGAE